jgi:hypothetical protein
MHKDNQRTSDYSWDNNRYYGSGIFKFNDKRQDIGSWRSVTGLDGSSTYAAGPPTGVWAFARPNKYEPGRGNVVVYNWDQRGSVNVDVSNVVRPGARYEVRDVQNLFGAPIAAGTYAGGAIAIPMTSTEKTRPMGVVPHIPEHTGADFGAFVITSR